MSTLLAIDLDGPLYDDWAAYLAYCKLTEQFLQERGTAVPDDMAAYQKDLRSKWNVASTGVALSLEFDMHIDLIAAALYLPIDLDECGVPRDNTSKRAALENVDAEKIIITSSPGAFLAKAIQHLGLEDCFTTLIGCEKMPKGKSNSATFTDLERQFSQHNRFILIDDSTGNTRAALQAGWEAYYYNPKNAAFTHEDCTSSGESLEEILRAL